MRELVSNAWDASATWVQINTNYPNFIQISVEDNGNGFDRDEFEKLMAGGIGNSTKRAAKAGTLSSRPIIGRLGIGMLGIAQICPSFTIVSNPKRGQAFRARVRLYDLLKEKLDKDDPLVVKTKEVDVGEYDFQDPVEWKGSGNGTLIVADDVHPSFTRAFRDSLSFEKFQKPPLEWQRALRLASRVHSLQELGDYWRLLWELSATCPIPYISATALPAHLIKKDQAALEKYDFKVIVDGIQLAKPVFLKGNPGGYTSREIEPQSRKIYGRDLEFHGYVVVQEGSQLRPDELRGILIRIKNVGIGYYDPSLLDYRFNEGPRSRWVTGEIFVSKGLEDALNIDRDSFNRFHPEFKAVQEYVHKMLREQIFPDVYKQIEVRSTARKEEREQVRRREIAKVISSKIESPVSLRYTPISQEKQAPRVRKLLERTVLSLPKPQTLPTKKSQQQLASAILGIFEISLREPTKDKQRSTFSDLLLDLLSRW